MIACVNYKQTLVNIRHSGFQCQSQIPRRPCYWTDFSRNFALRELYVANDAEDDDDDDNGDDDDDDDDNLNDE